MKIFISWSGDFSREVAEKLSIWIPCVIQSVDTFFSPDDIGKGENWNNVLSKELNDCNFGIVCLTPENVAAPWIHFEAGALAKALNSRLSSIMLGINASQVKGPLSRFQNTKFERNDFFKLLQTINETSGKPLKAETLTHLFNALWSQLENEIKPIIKKYEGTFTPSKATDKMNDSDAIQEILGIVRKISSNTSYSTPNTTSETSSKENCWSELTSLFISKRSPNQTLDEVSKKWLCETLPEGSEILKDLVRGNTHHMVITKTRAEFIKKIMSSFPEFEVVDLSDI